MKKQIDRWRIENATEKVYEYSKFMKAYVFYGTFFAIGLNKRMSAAEKLRIVENDCYNF